MSKRPPAEQIDNWGRKTTWSRHQMDRAIDHYFEVENFNQVAEQYDVPVTTLFYKVKADPRYQEDEEYEQDEKDVREGS